MRTIVDIPEEAIRWLDQRAAETGKSRTAVVREAVEAYRVEVGGTEGERKLAALEAGFGLWTRHGTPYDPSDYDRQRRAEWTRPWDEDYEQVRAVSPELFTEEDGRERAHYLRLFGAQERTGEDRRS